MTLAHAIKTFQIPSNISPTDDYLKKRFRFIASTTHPDKFFMMDEGIKLHAHLQFIELYKAYKLLISTSYELRLKELKTQSVGVIQNDTDTNKNTEETPYEPKADPFKWVKYPFYFGAGIYLILVIAPLFLMIHTFKDAIKEPSYYRTFTFGWFLGTTYVWFQIICYSSVFIYFAFLTFEYLYGLNTWLSLFFAVQLIVPIFYFLFIKSIRLILSKKYNSQVILKSMD
jgi:hypothetical protein